MVRGQWANLARMPGLHPYSFSKDILGFVMGSWDFVCYINFVRFNITLKVEKDLT